MSHPKWWLIEDSHLIRYLKRVEAQEITADEALADMSETAYVERVWPDGQGGTWLV